jgi:hypothetical protein
MGKLEDLFFSLVLVLAVEQRGAFMGRSLDVPVCLDFNVDLHVVCEMHVVCEKVADQWREKGYNDRTSLRRSLAS